MRIEGKNRKQLPLRNMGAEGQSRKGEEMTHLFQGYEGRKLKQKVQWEEKTFAQGYIT